MRGGAILAACLVPFVARGQVPPEDAPHYRNEMHHFSVELPKGMQACVDEYSHDHGVGILLVGGLKCDRDYDPTPRLEFFGEYNVAYEARTAEELAAIECKAKPGERVTMLHKLRLGGRPAAGCERKLPNGLIYVLIVMLRKDGNTDDVTDWDEIGIWLVTNRKRYNDDSRTMSLMANRLHIDPDDSPAKH